MVAGGVAAVGNLNPEEIIELQKELYNKIVKMGIASERFNSTRKDASDNIKVMQESGETLKKDIQDKSGARKALSIVGIFQMVISKVYKESPNGKTDKQGGLLEAEEGKKLIAGIQKNLPSGEILDEKNRLKYNNANTFEDKIGIFVSDAIEKSNELEKKGELKPLAKDTPEAKKSMLSEIKAAIKKIIEKFNNLLKSKENSLSDHVIPNEGDWKENPTYDGKSASQKRSRSENEVEKDEPAKKRVRFADEVEVRAFEKNIPPKKIGFAQKEEKRNKADKESSRSR